MPDLALPPMLRVLSACSEIGNSCHTNELGALTSHRKLNSSGFGVQKSTLASISTPALIPTSMQTLTPMPTPKPTPEPTSTPDASYVGNFNAQLNMSAQTLTGSFAITTPPPPPPASNEQKIIYTSPALTLLTLGLGIIAWLVKPFSQDSNNNTLWQLLGWRAEVFLLSALALLVSIMITDFLQLHFISLLLLLALVIDICLGYWLFCRYCTGVGYDKLRDEFDHRMSREDAKRRKRYEEA